MHVIKISILLAIFSFITNSYISFDDKIKTETINKELIVERHNYHRAKVGAPDIQWSDTLAEYAQNWAEKIAETCQLKHSGGQYGENIFWSTTPRAGNYVVDSWCKEEKYFNHKNTTYSQGKSSKSGHYSQVIWAKSLFVGAGVAFCANGSQMWVCVYDPPGNYIGEKAY